QYKVRGSPVPSTMANSTSMDSSNCCNSTSTYASGRQARGKCSARISVMFARITVEPTTIDRSVKANMKTPVTRKAVELPMPRVALKRAHHSRVVPRGVGRRCQPLPELAEPGFGVHRHVAGRGVGEDEVPPPPHLGQVGNQARPRGTRPQAVLRG